MRLKRKIAALLAVSMVVSGQPGMFTMTSAAEEKTVQEEEVSQEFDTASPSNADVATKSDADVVEPENEIYEVLYTVDPEEGARVKGKDEIRSGRDLTFKVYPEDGYEIESVVVNGEELEETQEQKEFLLFGSKYCEYQVESVREDLDIVVTLNEIEENTLSYELSEGLSLNITEKDKGALKDVAYMEAELLSKDEDIEKAIDEKLDESEAIADYAAIDIVLFDEEGNETEPEGAVTVSVEGIDTDEEYEKVSIYHIEETPDEEAEERSAAPKLSVLSAAEDENIYQAAKVTKGVKDQLSEEGNILFTADHFSTYVVTFIKDATTHKSVTYHLMKLPAEGEEAEELAYSKFQGEEFDVTLGDQAITIDQHVATHDMAEIQEDGADGLYYTYQYATASEDSTGDRLTKLSYEDIVNEDNPITDIYLWYSPSDYTIIEATAHFDDDLDGDYDTQKRVDLRTGSIDFERAQEALESASVEGIYSFSHAEIHGPDGMVSEIESVKSVNGNYYVTLDGEESRYEGDGYSIHLYFKKGTRLTIHVEGASTAFGNLVDGLAEPTINREIAKGETRTIPIEVAKGYKFTLTYPDGSTYDSSIEETQIRTFSFDVTGTDENQTFNVKFEKITPYLDYSHYQGRDDLNNGNYHGAEVKVNEKVVDPNGNTWETNIDGQSITMTVYSEVGVNDTQWILDAFAVNGQAVTVPEDSDGASSTGIIYDQQGDPIANVEITVEKEEKRNWFWGNVEGYARTYTIRFTNVASYLKITNFNLRASGHSEVVVQSLGEGLSLKSTPNGQPQENVGVNGLIWNSPAQLEVTPEFGYYMSEAVTSDGNASLGEWSGEWYGTQNAEIRFSGGLSYLDISSEKVPFHFSYSEAVDELGVPIPDSDGFTLGQTDYFSKAITSAVPKYPGGDLANPVFAGWRLGEEEGLYSQNSSISRETLQKYANNSDVIQYEENASLGAKIVLEPVFVDAAEAVTTQFSVEIYFDDDLVETISNAGTGNVGTYVTANDVEEIQAVKAAIEKKKDESGYGDYERDGVKTPVRLSLGQEASKNVFELYYSAPVKNVTVKNATDNGTIQYGEEEVAGTTLKLKRGEEVQFVITPDSGYVVSKVSINDQEYPVNQTGAYTLTYTVEGDDEIIVSYTRAYTLTYDGNGNTGGSVPAVETYVEGAEVTLALQGDLSREGAIFLGWSQTENQLITTEAGAETAGITKTLTMPGEDETVYAVWAKDEDGDKTPDYEETSYTLTYDGNGNTEGSVPAVETHVEGAEVTLAGRGGLVKAEAVFLGWSQTENQLITTEAGAEAAGIIKTLTMPGEDETVYAVWAQDEDGDKTPDYEETSYTLTYDGNGNTEGSVPAAETHVEGAAVTLATQGDLTKEGAIFLGWSEKQTKPITTEEEKEAAGIIETLTMPGEDETVYAVWAQNENGDEVPDYQEEKYDILYMAGEAGENVQNMPENVEGVLHNTNQTISGVKPTWTGYVFTSWTTDDVTVEGNSFTMPKNDVTFTAQWAVDSNGDGVPDEEQTVTITFDTADTSKGYFGTEENKEQTKVVTLLPGDPITSPADFVDVIGDDQAFDGWFDADGVEMTVVPETDEPLAITLTAQWALDRNHNNVPDHDEEGEGIYRDVTLIPYATTVYSGGANDDTDDSANSGFPNLEIEYKEAGRPIRKEAIEGIYINGVNVGSNVDEVFKAVYWNENGAAANDQVSDAYTITVVLGDAALGAVEGATAENGYLYKDGQRIAASSQEVEIVANEEASTARARAAVDSGLITYDVEIQNSTLTVRPLSDPAHPEETYRPLVSDPSQIDDHTKAAAVISEGSVFLTNDHEDRSVDRSGISLLVDTIQSHDFDRQGQLEAKAVETLGVNAQDWNYVTRYFDLVDTSNGNAWVSSSAGTDVYLPYPEGTDQNTEFVLYHFEGLHREEGLKGKSAQAAIAACVPTKMEVTNTEYGVMFHTEKEGFSPFVLMYQTADTDDGDDGGHGGNSGSSDSDHNIRTGSSRDSAYIVGVDGNWVHMDPANPNIPITVDVPEWATPVTNPEYHQWKFYLNNGLILWSRWAYVKNPYAVDGQPGEGWFYFDQDGIMQYGWYLDTKDNKWYYLHRTSDGMLGTLIEGWHFDNQDQKWYYLQYGTGQMLTGWQLIDGKWYYFNPVAPTATWNYNEATGGWTYNGSTSRPYGSMYQNEMTPDGYWVDENGAWVQ